MKFYGGSLSCHAVYIQKLMEIFLLRIRKVHFQCYGKETCADCVTVGSEWKFGDSRLCYDRKLLISTLEIVSGSYLSFLLVLNKKVDVHNKMSCQKMSHFVIFFSNVQEGRFRDKIKIIFQKCSSNCQQTSLKSCKNVNISINFPYRSS